MTRRRTSGPRGRTRGFTLIELLIASALLAILAVLAWRGLGAVLDSRRQIVAASDELRSLTLAFAQLDEDLRRSWPVRLLRLQTPSIGFTVSGEQAVATLELLREATGPTEPTQLQRVAWRLRGGVLERGFGMWAPPATDGFAAPSAGFASSAAASAGVAGAVGPDGAAGGGEAGRLVWQPVLAGVAQLQMQGWVVPQGWVAAEALAGQLSGGAGPAGSGPAAGAASTGGVASAAGAAAAGVPVTGGAGPQVTGLLVRIVRSDGRVLQRVLPVKD